jgi:conjugal transfer pilus assembly protein TraW
LGVHDKTYPIGEQDLVQVIEGKLSTMQKNGKFSELEKTVKARAQAATERPVPVAGVSKTVTERKFFFNPSITVAENLYDHQGQLIHQKGSILNPLDQLSLTKPILMIDGDDNSQIEWALLQEKTIGTATLILIKGPIMALRKKLDREIFFDQQGLICNRFLIKQVPARIQQQGKQLLIEELQVTI